MVKLEKIEMSGFKSFVSATEFLFGPGITAVVGPNGCGKSNIADSINWVIGVRSSKTLRADHMGDVIFNGTENRRPLGMAEVMLQLGDVEIEPSGSGGNGDGHPDEKAVDRRTVRITRRLFRGGDTDYLIDGQKRRLRDIQELLAQVGVGTGIYTIIEQGKIDQVITARPRDRRVLIEEAAGIALYKIRKRQAQSKLEATEANLARINDIVSELERQINSLKRQAAKARRYARITENIDRSERILFYHEAERLEALAGELRGRRGAAESEESEAAAALGRAEAELLSAREEAAAESERHQAARDALHTLDRSIDTLKRNVDRWREQGAAADGQIERSDREVKEVRARIAEAEARLAELSRSRAEAAEVCGSLEALVRDEEATLRLEASALQADESSLAAAREELVAAASEVSDARNDLHRLAEARDRFSGEVERLEKGAEGTEADTAELVERRRRHALGLEDVTRRLAHAAREAGAAERLLAHEESRREGLLVERERKRGLLVGIGRRMAALREIEEGGGGEEAGQSPTGGLRILKDELAPPEDLDRAVDAALRSLLRGVVTGTAEEAATLIRVLKESGRGRAIAIPEEAAPGHGSEEAPEPPPGSKGTLAALLGQRAAAIGALRPLLQRIVVAENLDEGFRIRTSVQGFDIVTLQGDLLSRDGWIEGGMALPEESGVMTLKRLLGRLEEEGARTSAEIEELDGALARAGERVGTLKRAEADWRGRRSDLDREADALRMRGEALDDEAARLSMKMDVQVGERDRAREDLAGVVESLERARRDQEGSLRRQEELQRAVESLTGSIEDLRGSLQARREALASQREEAAASRVGMASLEAELHHFTESKAELTERLRVQQEERVQWEARKRESLERMEEDSRALSDGMAERILAEGAVASAEAKVEERRQSLETLEGRVRGARSTLDTRRESLHKLALDEERHAGDRRSLEARVAERGWGGIAAAAAGLTDEDKCREIAEVEAELAEWKEKRDRMGPVNLMAMEQFRELEERFTFIGTQRRDLEESIHSLKETIARINRQSRERFITAFESIRKHFSELYKILFAGGRADLRLSQEGEEESDILEAGLEITAQPPGKRLQSISLLSGGEKALTALALLFAIFRYSPSPFCLLDEVDAALDELNVSRFVSLLKTLADETQFIVITHSRRTMEEANMLYGVTMEEPGVSRTVSVVMGSPEHRREAARTLPEQMVARHRGNGRTARAGSPPLQPPEA